LNKKASLSAQLPVWQFVNDFLAFSDHSFSAGFKIQGIDISCMDHQEINLIVDQLEKMLLSLDSGCRIQIFYRLQPKVSDRLDQHLEVSKDATPL
jgi:hypothetical protein